MKVLRIFKSNEGEQAMCSCKQRFSERLIQGLQRYPELLKQRLAKIAAPDLGAAIRARREAKVTTTTAPSRVEALRSASTHSTIGPAPRNLAAPKSLGTVASPDLHAALRAARK